MKGGREELWFFFGGGWYFYGSTQNGHVVTRVIWRSKLSTDTRAGVAIETERREEPPREVLALRLNRSLPSRRDLVLV